MCVVCFGGYVFGKVSRYVFECWGGGCFDVGWCVLGLCVLEGWVYVGGVGVCVGGVCVCWRGRCVSVGGVCVG